MAVLLTHAPFCHIANASAQASGCLLLLAALTVISFV
jgi:hypothetical protein